MRILFGLLAFAFSVAHAQTYPSRPIHVLVPFAPGGAVDTTARVLAQAMQQRVNWNFVIENRPGGSRSRSSSSPAAASPARARARWCRPRRPVRTARGHGWAWTGRSARERRKMRTRAVQRESSLLPPFLGGELHRFDDFRVRRAAAKVTGKVVPDRVVVGIRVLVEELARHQDETGGAEAALEGAALDERFLHRVGFGIAFDRNDVSSLGQRGEVETPRNRAAIDEQSATAAQALAAALARAVQAERSLQYLHQSLVRLDLRLDCFAVQAELNGASHFFCSAMKTASGFIGNSVRRTPTASWMALAIAGETPKVAVSPTPLPPKGPLRCSATTASFVITSGRSKNPGILYSASDAFLSRPSESNSIFSN